MAIIKQKKAKLSNGNTREDLIKRLPIPGPGRPKLTEEQKLIKKATKEIIQEYEDNLVEVLPQLSPVLKAKALEGDMSAIKEIHEVVGLKADKDKGSTLIQANFNVFIDKYNNLLDGQNT